MSPYLWYYWDLFSFYSFLRYLAKYYYNVPIFFHSFSPFSLRLRIPPFITPWDMLCFTDSWFVCLTKLLLIIWNPLMPSIIFLLTSKLYNASNISYLGLSWKAFCRSIKYYHSFTWVQKLLNFSLWIFDDSSYTLVGNRFLLHTSAALC